MTAAIAVEKKSSKTRSRQPWAPDEDDHLIYFCVKFQGQTQALVASDMGLSQGTISRAIQRYERWQARAEAQADGRLNHAERLRAQRWLTFERNELIVQSCLRIAREMEGFADLSRTTYERPRSGQGTDRQINTRYTVDQHGVAARFLRLAYRINMDQLKLAEKDDLPPLPPLSGEQLAAEEAAAADCREQLAARRQRIQDAIQEGRAQRAEQERQRDEQAREVERLREVEEAERLALAKEVQGRESGVGSRESEVEEAAGAHNAHHDAPEETTVSADVEETCGENGRSGKKSRYARMSGSAPKRGTAKRRQKSQRRGEQAALEVRIAPEKAVTTSAP